MDYKINNLSEKVYKNFILGVYGTPKIPTKNEVIKKISEFTDVGYSPVTTQERLSELTISGIRGKFSDIIDDVDVLFSSVESESQDILDQLTNSLKEHNGVKRELKRIKSSTEDIVNGTLGSDYLKYNYTESFDDSTNIMINKSHQINTDSGTFTINNATRRILSLNHYRGKKLEFNVTEFFSPIVDK
jgi:hypothetical protein